MWYERQPASEHPGDAMIRSSRWSLLVLFCIPLCLSLVTTVTRRFDGLYGQDAFAYYDYARDLAARIAQGLPPTPFVWPIGYPVLVALAALPLGWQPAAGQFVAVLAGAAVPVLTYL